LSRVAVAAALAFASCSRCGASNASNDQLTEKNSFAPPNRQVHAADGGAFTLTMPDGNWRVVADELRARVRPEVEAWVVNPVRGAFVTVQCVREQSPAQLEAALTVAAQRVGRTVSIISREALVGPWQQALELTYKTSAGQESFVHDDGLFDLVTETCAVQAWSTDPAQAPELRRVVRSFAPQLTPAVLALLAPLQVLGEDKVKAHMAGAEDAGVSSIAVTSVMVARGLARLGEAALDERFELRRRLLESLPEPQCGSVVMRAGSPELLIDALNHLPAEAARRWGELSVEAMRAEIDGVPPQPPSRLELADAQREYLALEHTREAEILLQSGSQNAADVCEAERTRLKAAFTLSREVRGRLFRSWLGQ
jgi:hypothetical protein